MLYGDPAAGKSFLVLDWGLSVTTEVPSLGHEVKKGEVVYIYGEGLRSLRKRRGAPEGAQLTDTPGFRAVPLAVTIADDGEREEFVNAVRSVSKHPQLIIIDTLSGISGRAMRA